MVNEEPDAARTIVARPGVISSAQVTSQHWNRSELIGQSILLSSGTALCGAACRVVWGLRLEAHEIQRSEMTALVKPSQQPGTESCVVLR